MKNISQTLDIAPDVLEGATIVTLYGSQSALVENFKSIICFTPCEIRLQGRHMKLLFEGTDLQIDRLTRDDCKICGNIQNIQCLPL